MKRIPIKLTDKIIQTNAPIGTNAVSLTSQGAAYTKNPAGVVEDLESQYLSGSEQTNTVDLSNPTNDVSLSINNIYKFPLTDGLSGQYLTTNGGGTLSWVNIVGPLGGSGSPNYLTKFSNNGVTSSLIYNTSNSIGIGTLTLTETVNVVGNLRIAGQYYNDVPSVNMPSGTTQTINWNNGNFQSIDMENTTGNLTLTFTNPKVGAIYVLKIIQGPTARTIIYPASVKWEGVTPLVPTTTNNAIDLITMFWDGTNYLGNYIKNFS